jgi:hypothetical protein
MSAGLGVIRLRLRHLQRGAAASARCGLTLEAQAMIRIAISVEAYDAISAILTLGSVGYEVEANERGERAVWLEDAMADRLGAMRGPGETLTSAA